MRWATGMALLGIAAMGAHPAPGAAQVIRDSGGVRIVSNNEPNVAAARMFHLAPMPALAIGRRDEPPYELARVTGAVRLTDGSIVIANSGSFELRYYNAKGDYITAAGRRGQGPGEFNRMAILQRLRGDTIAAFDLFSVHFFTPGGGFIKSISVRNPPITGLAAGPPMVLALWPDGSRVVTTAASPPPRPRGDQWVDARLFVILDSVNVVRHELGILPFLQITVTDSPGRPWFGAQHTAAYDTEAFYYGIGDEYSIRVYARDGRLARIIRRRWMPPRVTKSDIDAFVAEWGKRWIKPTDPAAGKRYDDIRNDAYASVVPAFSQLIVDATGRLWARQPRAGDAAWAGQLDGLPLSESTWSVFDTSGRWLNDVVTPARFLVTDIGRDYVLGVARDADDVETVALYRLVGWERMP